MIRREPSKPGRPVARYNSIGIYVSLTWTEPEDDGGAEVTGYVIKYDGHCLFIFRDTDSDTESGELCVDGNTTNFQFTHQLNEHMSYQFAVAAVNAVGRGEFSEFTDNVSIYFGKYCCKSVRIQPLSSTQ